MDETFFDLMELWKKPSITETFVDILLCAVPIWLAVMIGLVIGWSWRPRWTGLVFLGLRSKFRFLWTAPPGFGARRLWLAFTALSAFSVCRTIWSNFKGKNGKSAATAATSASTLPALARNSGPTIFRSKTIFEDATAELVRDFFWDDEFRLKWDPMLAYFEILEEFPCTGTMIVHWIKKFPFFCSDREYIIGRRIWEAGKTYYCVTKGVPYPGLPKRDKPRRVEHYFSSWVIRAVESRKGDGQMSGCEVILLHCEDMGIPKMWLSWDCVMKRTHGENYNKNSLTKVWTSEPVTGEVDKGQVVDIKRHKDQGIDWKWIVIGGTVALVCGLHSGAVGKGLLLGAGQRIARR
ncbi:hypothetical protein GH714_020754 [Hevea brasiliensis]|uniref:START domain-containing protein n=1 Tax=Hevea brasiliensis TaxID=3981 RepID=A0A6A6MJL8_HEVBR|nr:hypothetical protein GH714_020754 [Hevea brasiliensis]